MNILGDLVAMPVEKTKNREPVEGFDGFCYHCCEWRELVPRVWFLTDRGFDGAFCGTCHGSSIQPSRRSLEWFYWYRSRASQPRKQ
jgi:hypothetical protein